MSSADALLRKQARQTKTGRLAAGLAGWLAGWLACRSGPNAPAGLDGEAASERTHTGRKSTFADFGVELLLASKTVTDDECL
ncbi:hypothetical protein EYF80_028938 [Liparis tanakae]|uniref:Uncharacterized protein n=1 Tax=Liparis tanakae TaxID=230148 RepID=A0A4Z2H5D5_9TELE|nr:hypothetical protein EYF80_028938 [Liparis tanakae]